MQPPAHRESKLRAKILSLRHLPALIRLAWDACSWLVVLSLLIRFVTACLPLLIAKIAALIVSGVVDAAAGRQSAFNLWGLVALEVLLALVVGLGNRLLEYFGSQLSDRYIHHVTVLVMEQAGRLDLATFDDPIYYDRLERAKLQTADRLGTIQFIGLFLQHTFATVAASIALAIYSPWLVVVLICGVAPSFLGEAYLASLRHEAIHRQTPTRRTLNYLRDLMGNREGAKEVKLFGLAEFLIDRFQQISESMCAENRHLALKRFFLGQSLTVVGTIGFYATYVLIIVSAVKGHYDLQTFIFLSALIMQASGNLQQMCSTAASIADQALNLTDLVEFFEMKPQMNGSAGAILVPRPLKRGFQFVDVSFAYPGTTQYVLKNLKFTLGSGERVALVGANGQGKTTIVKLITRLYDPTEGQILLDGVDLREYSVEDLRKATAVIFQDFMKYDMTAGENIALAGLCGRASMECVDQLLIESAAQKSMADKLINTLPKGYDQMLGRRFAGGHDLSGGEWQKLALARAYLRDAQLLVLDEPTAALDAKGEFEVFQRFAELTAGKTALLISHRLSTVRMADRVVVLDGGRLIEQGKHADLMSQKGTYAMLFKMQASNYH